jgi:hypothetical protein
MELENGDITEGSGRRIHFSMMERGDDGVYRSRTVSKLVDEEEYQRYQARLDAVGERVDEYLKSQGVYLGIDQVGRIDRQLFSHNGCQSDNSLMVSRLI